MLDVCPFNEFAMKQIINKSESLRLFEYVYVKFHSHVPVISAAFTRKYAIIIVLINDKMLRRADDSLKIVVLSLSS